MLDLLSGEDPLPHPLAQPVTDNLVYQENDPLDFLGLGVDNHGAKSDGKFSAEDARHSDSSAEQYLTCLKTLAGPGLVCYQFHDVSMNHKFSKNILFSLHDECSIHYSIIVVVKDNS